LSLEQLAGGGMSRDGNSNGVALAAVAGWNNDASNDEGHYYLETIRNTMAGNNYRKMIIIIHKQ